MSFDKNIFINCPFDREYYLLLRPLLFTVIYLGFTPRIALERSDCGEIRIAKICELIKDSKYSIHDLSRLKPASGDEFSRLNMPFELGLDIGCRIFSDNHLKNKKCLILETDKYRFMKAISDISGSDIKNHDNEPAKLVQQVRNWFAVNVIPDVRVHSPSTIWYSFIGFTEGFYGKRKSEGFNNEDLDIMPIPEYISFIEEWCLNAKRSFSAIKDSVQKLIDEMSNDIA